MSNAPLKNLTLMLSAELEKPVMMVLIGRHAGAFGIGHAVVGLTAEEMEGAIGALLNRLANMQPDHKACPCCTARPERARAALAELSFNTVGPETLRASASTH